MRREAWCGLLQPWQNHEEREQTGSSGGLAHVCGKEDREQPGCEVERPRREGGCAFLQSATRCL